MNGSFPKTLYVMATLKTSETKLIYGEVKTGFFPSSLAWLKYNMNHNNELTRQLIINPNELDPVLVNN